MKKTHKKILGFAGLGIVAAVTTIAAVLPSPIASAVTASVTDRIEVHITSNDPILNLTATGGSEVTTPDYSFLVSYNKLTNIKFTIINKTEDGRVIFPETEFKNISLDGSEGSESVSVNFDSYGGYGNFTITATGIDENNVPIIKTITVKYTETPSEKDPDDPIPTGPIPKEVVYSATYELFDANGNPVTPPAYDNWPMVDVPPVSPKEFNFAGLADGIYTLRETSKNEEGDILGVKETTIVIDHDKTGEDMPIVVEDIGEEISKVTVTLKNSADTQLKFEEFTNPNPGDILNFQLPSNLEAGVYTLITDYYNNAGEKVKTVITTFIVGDTDNKVIVDDVNRVLDTVTEIDVSIYDDEGNLVRTLVADRETGEMKVYDKDGRLISTIPNGYKDGKIVFPMDGLESGTYTGVIMFKNKYGRLVGNTKTVKIKWDAEKGIIVPDTGSFFEGLNISREDFLLTGLVVFMIIGVVAFGVVKKNRNRR